MDNTVLWLTESNASLSSKHLTPVKRLSNASVAKHGFAIYSGHNIIVSSI